jgi:hypothetical protein
MAPPASHPGQFPPAISQHDQAGARLGEPPLVAAPEPVEGRLVSWEDGSQIPEAAEEAS